MKHIKLIEDEQLLEQISGGKALVRAVSISPVKAAVIALAAVFNIRLKAPAKKTEAF
jgi:hypothetical protein